MTYDRREVYPYAPLQLVAAEVRYSYSPRLKQEGVLDAIQVSLEHVLPVRKTLKEVGLAIDPAGSVNHTENEVFRLFDRRFHFSVAITPESVSVESTDYEDFDAFQKLVVDVMVAISEAATVGPVERVGLRYIDEVRSPEKTETAADWGKLIAADLVASISVSPVAVSSFQGVMESRLTEREKLVLRYGALDGPGVVQNAPLVRREQSEPGPFFLLDIDCFWEASSPVGAVDFDSSGIAETLGRLHGPTGETFQNCITDFARSIFRGEAK